MAQQNINLGEVWESVFEKLNANFTELFSAQGDSVTASELTAQLASYVTSAALANTLADYVTSTAFSAAIADFITESNLNAILDGYTTAQELSDALANRITSTQLSTALADYVTNAALTTAIANKVDKIAGKDLSTNDYTTAEKQKLAGLSAPTKQEFTANSWGTADASGVYSYSITSAQTVAAVFRENGSAFDNAAVAVSVSGGTVTLKSEEAFAGYVVLV